MKYRAVVFDFDGTLVDSMDYLARLHRKALSMSGYDVSLQQVKNAGGASINDFYRQIVPSMPLKHILKTSLNLLRVRRTMKESFQLFPGTLKTLETLKQNNVQLAIVTSRHNPKTCLRRAGIREYFRIVVGYGIVRRPKPHPDPFQIVSHKLHIHPSEILSVGDSFNDIIATKKAGAKAAAFLSGTQTKAYLKKAKPDYFIKSIEETIPLVL